MYASCVYIYTRVRARTKETRPAKEKLRIICICILEITIIVDDKRETDRSGSRETDDRNREGERDELTKKRKACIYI